MSTSLERLRSDHVIDLQDGKFAKTTTADLAQLFSKIKRDPNGKNLIFHFHGGLVSRKSALTAANDLYDTYRAGGAYPVFVIWNSDIVNTIRFNLREIAQEKAFRRLLLKLAQFLAGKIVERPGARGRLVLPPVRAIPKQPEALAEYLEGREEKPFPNLALPRAQQAQLERELKADRVLRSETRAIMEAYRSREEQDENAKAYRRSRGKTPSRSSGKTLMSRKVLRKIEREAPRPGARGGTLLTTLAWYGVKVTRAVLRRYRRNRDHGLYTTIVEEILRELYLDNVGQIGWNMMKKDTLDAFGGDPEEHAGTALIAQLEALGRRGQRVTLAGHSTGAIFIGHLLEHADKKLSKSRKFDVIYFAPACTFQFMYDRLPVYKRRVAGFRSFGLEDDLEHGYWEVPVLYNASLLYLVSGLFEEAGADTPLVGMKRHFDTAVYTGKEIKAVSGFLTDRLWSVVDAGDGRRSAARKHGRFEREKRTKESQRHILRHGF